MTHKIIDKKNMNKIILATLSAILFMGTSVLTSCNKDDDGTSPISKKVTPDTTSSIQKVLYFAAADDNSLRNSKISLIVNVFVAFITKSNFVSKKALVINQGFLLLLFALHF